MTTDLLASQFHSKVQPVEHARTVEPSTHLSHVLGRCRISTADAAVVVCMALLFFLEIGIKNGELNQVFYLLRGLRQANPALLARDWYTVDSVPYHLWWNALIGCLAKANFLVLGLTLGTVFVSIAFTVSVSATMRTLYAEPVLPCVLALMLFGGLFTRGLGDWDLLASSVEPFSASGVALVCGLAFLARGEPLGAGLCLGFSAFLHPHFAVLLSGVLLISAVPLYLVEGPRFLALVAIPFAFLAAPTLWQVYTFASAPGGSEALRILSTVAPQHYLPWRAGVKPFVLFGSSLTLGIAGIAIRRPRLQPALFIVLASALIIVLGSLFACRLAVSTILERALPWRLACIVMLAGLLAGAAGLAQGWRRSPAGPSALPWWVLAYSALALSAAYGTTRMRWAVLVAGAVPIVVSWMRNLPSDSTSQFLPILSLAAVLVGMGPVALAELRKSHFDIRSIERTRSQVYFWARSSTPLDSLWIVPLDWKDFRLNAKRAIVVDWSATPFYPADVIEWHRRMRDVTGLNEIRTADQVNRAYEAMDCRRVDYLQQTYAIDYVVTGVSAQLPCGVAVYRDERFAVWKVRGAQVRTLRGEMQSANRHLAIFPQGSLSLIDSQEIMTR